MTLRLILGDQLNPKHSWYRHTDPDVLYVLMELRQETDYVVHHIQKVVGFFAAMRRFAARLEQKGHRVIYLSLNDPENHVTLEGNLLRLVKTHGISRFEYQFPDEYRLDRQLEEFADRLGLPGDPVDTEHFLTGRYHVARFFSGRKQFVMEPFYRDVRKRLGVLMDDDEPVGGRWNWDIENRSKWTGGVPIPEPKRWSNDCVDIVGDIESAGVKTIGSVDPKAFPWPVDRRQALAQLRYFVEHLLPRFGTYQDALTMESGTLFHSRLSFALNVKLLHPGEVVHRAIEAWQASDGEISLPQIEGFVRQIIGWREYIRGMYWAFMPEAETDNFFGFTRPLPGFYWTGDTRMNCVRHAVTQSLDTAYAHHIQRLMVTGNFALLAGVAPSEVERWYLGIYIDAVQWVELPNTMGMSQYADGGRLATKPYVASANYMHKMSDYCGGCRYDRRKRVGENACPFNSLYWNFLIENRMKLEANHRMRIVYRQLDRMDEREKAALQKQAASYLQHIEEL